MQVLVGTQKIFIPWLKDVTSMKWSLSPDKLGKVLSLSTFPFRLSPFRAVHRSSTDGTVSSRVSRCSPHSFFSKSIKHTTVIPVWSSWDMLVAAWLYFIPFCKESCIKSCTMRCWINYALDLIATSQFLLTIADIPAPAFSQHHGRLQQERTQKAVWAIPCSTAE